MLAPWAIPVILSPHCQSSFLSSAPLCAERPHHLSRRNIAATWVWDDGITESTVLFAVEIIVYAPIQIGLLLGH